MKNSNWTILVVYLEPITGTVALRYQTANGTYQNARGAVLRERRILERQGFRFIGSDIARTEEQE